MPFYPGSNSGGSGTVTDIVAGPGLSGGTITTAGTIAIAEVAAQSFLFNSGTVADVPSGHTLVAGSNITITAGNTISASGGTASATNGNFGGFPLLSVAAGTSFSSSAFAIKGTRLNPSQTVTVDSIGVSLGSVVNGGSYTAWMTEIDGSNVVLAVDGSNTIVASGTNSQDFIFTLNSGKVCVPGTIYGAVVGRIDSVGTFVLPVLAPAAATGYWPGFQPTTQSLRVAATNVAVGTTFDVTASAAPIPLSLHGFNG